MNSLGSFEELAEATADTPFIELDGIAQRFGNLKALSGVNLKVRSGEVTCMLILDEPTAALGVKQSGVVLKYVAKTREAGLGVIFITHNPHHAFMVGDHFVVLKLGEVELDSPRDDLTLDDLTHHMSGGGELESLQHELARVTGPEKKG